MAGTCTYREPPTVPAPQQLPHAFLRERIRCTAAIRCQSKLYALCPPVGVLDAVDQCPRTGWTGMHGMQDAHRRPYTALHEYYRTTGRAAPGVTCLETCTHCKYTGGTELYQWQDSTVY